VVTKTAILPIFDDLIKRGEKRKEREERKKKINSCRIPSPIPPQLNTPKNFTPQPGQKETSHDVFFF